MKLLRGDARLILPTLEAKSIHCCVTSPPYWGLRDYGTATWDGGDAECDHSSAKIKGRGDYGFGEKSQVQTTNISAGYTKFKDECHCGARRIDSQLGLEPTPDAYVANMVAVFREVRRVLRDDGTLWLILGDSYGSKNLVGIPWRVAFALQADGWWLRQDIIWSKPNPMPESVTDRCTKAHEYIFLLSKSARYYYDAEAIAEPGVNRASGTNHGAEGMCAGYDGHRTRANLANGIEAKQIRNKRSVWEVATSPFSEAHFATFPPALIEPCILAGCPKDGTVLDPFGGAGTTGLVADRLQRNAILIELNHDYAEMARTRIIDDLPLFATVE